MNKKWTTRNLNKFVKECENKGRYAYHICPGYDGVRFTRAQGMIDPTSSGYVLKKVTHVLHLSSGNWIPVREEDTFECR